jgi:hypothetical protein
VLAHLLVRAAVGLDQGHRRETFGRLARAIGLEGPLRRTRPGKDFQALFTRFQNRVGEYPHAALYLSDIDADDKAKSAPRTRMLKAHCPVCGYTVRAARSWLQIAVPACPNPKCAARGHAMACELTVRAGATVPPTSTASNTDSSSGDPAVIYSFFAGMEVEDLEQLALDAVVALSAATTRTEAEQAVIQLTPFFLDCTFPRLSETTKQRLRDVLDQAEEQFGSLAGVLGLEDEPD